MSQITINGDLLEPQPASTEWQLPIAGNKLDATQALAAYATFIVTSPPIKNQFFNWKSYENLVLTSLGCYAPGETPEGTPITYSSGVVSRKITAYQQPEDRTVRQIRMEILVVI